MKNFKVLIKRDLAENYIETKNYIPKDKELIVAYEIDDEYLIFKIGDGKTSWFDLPEIIPLKKLSIIMDEFCPMNCK
jgi:hypothetical protein